FFSGPAALSLRICLLLAVSVLALYWPVSGHDFITLDDGNFVFENADVKYGLTWHGAVRALTVNQCADWHPITWWSHMLDCQLFGLRPGAHHMVSAFLHAANTVLLFLVLRSMTGATWRSAVVAALFGLHPLHVESVAWISERKDVLSTFFWMLALGAYVGYVQRPSVLRYVAVALAFALGLM